jgi:hypothetical protein
METRPQEIVWAQVEKEAETGKTFVSPHPDKEGRPVVMMRPRCGSSTCSCSCSHLQHCGSTQPGIMTIHSSCAVVYVCWCSVHPWCLVASCG